jgi:sulfur carrier protein
VAVEHNLEIIKRQRFPDVVVNEGDSVEIVNFVGGGHGRRASTTGRDRG